MVDEPGWPSSPACEAVPALNSGDDVLAHNLPSAATTWKTKMNGFEVGKGLCDMKMKVVR